MQFAELIAQHFIGINDSTLREGEQFNSAEFSLDSQKQILTWLYLVGVNTAEVGNPILSEIYQDLHVLTRMADRPPLMAHILNREKDLAAAIDSQVQGVHLMCTVDPTRLVDMNITLEQHIETMIKNVRRAQAEDLMVRVSVEHGLEDRFFSDTLRVLQIADSLGVDRVQVADTRGVLLPWDVFAIITSLRQEIQTQIGVHLHNDLGLAPSNALFALAAGANWVDTTILGIGERTGVVALCRLLPILFKIDPRLVKRYSLSLLTMIDQEMAKMLGISVPPNLITSPTAFSHKAGVHTNGIRKQGNETYEPFAPEVVGNQRVIVTGSRISGRAKIHG